MREEDVRKDISNRAFGFMSLHFPGNISQTGLAALGDIPLGARVRKCIGHDW